MSPGQKLPTHRGVTFPHPLQRLTVAGFNLNTKSGVGSQCNLMLNLILNLSRLVDPKLRISKSVDCGTQKFYLPSYLPSFLLLVTNSFLNRGPHSM